MAKKSALVLLAVTLFVFPVLAQESSRSEFSVDVSGNSQAQKSGQGVVDNSSHSGGLLVGYRHDFKKWGGLEANYDFTRFTQYYSSLGVEPAVLYKTQANVNQFTLAFVSTLGRPASARIRPFVEAGPGALLFSPVATGSNVPGVSQARPALLVGAGADWHATRKISLRLGYRGLFYEAPDFGIAGQRTNSLTNMAEPYVGLVIHL